jgi:ubiquitin carboxyl-terminal hydrolase 1
VDEGEDGNVTEWYKLMSVVTHKGLHDSGHYICYRRRKRERKTHRRLSVSQMTKAVTAIQNAEAVSDDKGQAAPGKREELEDGVIGSGANEEDVQIELVYSRRKWWEISDEVVTGVSKTDMLSKRNGVYILFYERTL